MTDLRVGRIEQLTHTPGPWRISTLDARTVGPERDLTAHGTTVTQLQAVARVTERGIESDANARLIAAAPELLAALKAIVAVLQKEAPGTRLNHHSYDTIGAQAHAAIAKAEGRK